MDEAFNSSGLSRLQDVARTIVVDALERAPAVLPNDGYEVYDGGHTLACARQGLGVEYVPHGDLGGVGGEHGSPLRLPDQDSNVGRGRCERGHHAPADETGGARHEDHLLAISTGQPPID